MQVSFILLFCIQTHDKIRYVVASWCSRRLTSLHWPRHRRHDVLYSVFSIPVWPNAKVRQWKLLVGTDWLTFHGCLYISTDQFHWSGCCRTTLWRPVSSRGMPHLLTNFKWKWKSPVSVFAILYVVVVCSYASLFPLSPWLTATLSPGTVSGHAIEHDLYCCVCGTREEYAFIQSMQLVLTNVWAVYVNSMLAACVLDVSSSLGSTRLTCIFCCSA
jgi:hypothetical protein